MYIQEGARRASAVVLAVRDDPAADAGFVGRDEELGALLDLLNPRPAAGPVASDDSSVLPTPAGSAPVVVSAVAGAPGVGETALAQAAARKAVAQGWFPGGALWVDLHGYAPNAGVVVSPAQLWAALLRGLGLPGEDVPADEAEQATVFHQGLDRLAAAGRPVAVRRSDHRPPKGP